METGRHKETLSACPLQQGNKERVGTPNFLRRKSKAGKGASHRVASAFLWAADASANSKCGELIMVQIRNQIIAKIAWHIRMEQVSRTFKQGTVSYHKNKAEAYKEVLAMLDQAKVGV